MTTAFFTDERTFWHSTGLQALFLPVGGWVQPPSGSSAADTPDSKRRLLSLLAASGMLNDMAVSSADPVTRDDLLRVHGATYVDAFKAASDAGGGDIGDYAPFSAGGYEIACLSAGLAKAAIEGVMTGKARNAYALCRPAGHHCLPDRSMGFCVLANIPIAIEAARAKHGLSRVAILDWDVHHGNGTQTIYYDRADTLTISIHQENCFPFGYSGGDDRGEGEGLGTNLNIPLPPGAGDAAYRATIKDLVIPALEAFKPEMIVIASGLDAGAADPMARMLVHSDTFRSMTESMMEVADRLCGGRLIVVHEGGYSEASVPFLGAAIVEALMGTRSSIVDPTLDIFKAQQPSPPVEAFQLDMVRQFTEAWKQSRTT